MVKTIERNDSLINYRNVSSEIDKTLKKFETERMMQVFSSVEVDTHLERAVRQRVNAVRYLISEGNLYYSKQDVSALKGILTRIENFCKLHTMYIDEKVIEDVKKDSRTYKIMDMTLRWSEEEFSIKNIEVWGKFFTEVSGWSKKKMDREIEWLKTKVD